MPFVTDDDGNDVFIFSQPDNCDSRKIVCKCERLPIDECSFCGNCFDCCKCERVQGMKTQNKGAWRTLPTDRLIERAEFEQDSPLGNPELADEMWEEIAEREAQCDANGGAMNGLAPQF